MDKLSELYYGKIKDKLTDKRFLSVALLVVFVLAITGCYIRDYCVFPEQMLLPNEESISFSLQSGFYSDCVEVSLSLSADVPVGAKICYSLDGTDPNELHYDQPITLECVPDETRVYVIKAAVSYLGKLSSTVSRTYVLGGEAFDIDFISITVDEDKLNDYETGIFQAGKTYDDNVAAGNKGFIRGNYNNRGEEWIRDARMVMLDSDGELLIDSAIGLGVAGNTSASYSVKSLKIVGQSEALDYGKINLDLSPSDISDFSMNDRHNSLRLRSGSQDMNSGNLRSAIVSRLVSQAGFDGCVSTRRALVYLNGRIYGVFDIQENLSGSFLKNRFTLPDSENLVQIESHEIGAFMRSDTLKYVKADLSVPENQEELEKHIDMDNLLTYYAVEFLIDNTDWPGNNIKMWYYTGGYDGVNKYTDGRCRYLIFDTDLAYYIKGNYVWFDGCVEDNFVSVMENTARGEGSIFPEIMKVTKYREEFLTILSDLLAGAFKTENVLKVIDEEYEKIDGTYNKYFSQETNDMRNNGVALLKESAANREEQMRRNAQKYLGDGTAYTLSIASSEGVTLSWVNKTVYPEQEYSCEYFGPSRFTVSAECSPGYEFLYFTVNGNAVYSDAIEISQSLAENGAIELKAVCRRKAAGVPVIEQISARGGDDWLTVKNVGTKSVSLDGYYISDTSKNLMQFALPKTELEAGESVKIYCKNNRYQLDEYICNFNISAGEVLYLYNGNTKAIEDSVFAKSMGSNETYKRYLDSSEFKFVKNSYSK